MGDDYDFSAEYAKSGRAACKLCKDAIPKDSLRLAIMVQSPHFDGKVPNWHHFRCFWARAKKCNDPADIHGFTGLRWEDQKKITDKLGVGSTGAGPSGKAKSVKAVEKDIYSDFLTEYAKSGAAVCRACEEKIGKGEVRLAKKEYESFKAKSYGPVPLWHHVECFITHRMDLGFDEDMDPKKIPGYIELSVEDKKMLVEKLGAGNPDAMAAKLAKRKAGGEGDQPAAKKAKGESPEEKALREQSELLWKMRDKLKDEVSNDAMRLLLEVNGQESVKAEGKLLDRLVDAMVFGALLPCPDCKGQIVPGTTGYHCTGDMSEWTKCSSTTLTPKRRAFKVPPEFHDVAFLAKYQYKKRSKVFPKHIADALVKSPSNGASCLPLTGMRFVIGKTTATKAALTKKIEALGGDIVSAVDGSVMAVVSTDAEVEKMSKHVKAAKQHEIHVVGEAYCDAVKQGGAVLLIKEHSLCDWGSEPQERVREAPVAPVKSAYKKKMEEKVEQQWTKSMPAMRTMTLKGGAAVDPDAQDEIGREVHVVEVGGVSPLREKGKPDFYNAALAMVDVTRGTNSYYKLQVLELDNGQGCWIFRAWGRTGTTIGGTKLEKMPKQAAIHEFKTLYREKTLNDWEDRHNFVKHPSKFYPLDIDYETEDTGKTASLAGPSTSLLPAAVQDLIRLIFDVDTMKKAMMEFEIDLKKMPLGKLSKKQIQLAYSGLSELQTLVESGGSSAQFVDASNRFYTLIPHDFGMRKPPLLDSADVIKAKTDMLDNLLEIEIAYNMLKTGEAAGEDPIDTHYEKLKTDLQVVERDSEEFATLKAYVQNTHAATHTTYTLDVEHVFKVEREGEHKRFKPFKPLGNRQLLWHGSRITNFAGILSQGLRIAPPEAPVTGYMFGKGVYFADMVSKSANYCFATRQSPTGLLLLCDVALGNMHLLQQADHVTKLPKGKHSTKGEGRTEPDPAGIKEWHDDVTIPMGNGVDSDAQDSSLLYNEYIVYDTAQVNMKYLMKLKFNYS